LRSGADGKGCHFNVKADKFLWKNRQWTFLNLKIDTMPEGAKIYSSASHLQ
jgi:hypothetical protein